MSDGDQVGLTQIFQAIRNGEEGAAERLFAVVYDELHRMAHAKMARELPGQTLQTTALVHEAYLRLAGKGQATWENRRHFFGAAAEAMRRILIDRARRRAAGKHGGSLERVPLQDDVPDAERPEDLIALDEALTRLAAERPRHADVVKYRYFLGLGVEETAKLLDVSPRTADDDWRFAKGWLRREMTR